MTDLPLPDSIPAGPSEAVRVGLALTLGVIGAVVAAFTLPWSAVPLVLWIVTAVMWAMQVWAVIIPMDADATSLHATREDPRGAVAVTLVLAASMAGLAAVVLGIVQASSANGWHRPVLLGLGIASIVSSWGVVHTVFTLRYAGLYYDGTDGGVEFNETEKPVYIDFAYLSFTIGMTYQVSDTNLTTKPVRHAALRHALLSYLLGTVIIAATINLAAGLVK